MRHPSDHQDRTRALVLAEAGETIREDGPTPSRAACAAGTQRRGVGGAS